MHQAALALRRRMAETSAVASWVLALGQASAGEEKGLAMPSLAVRRLRA
jgi:hypothetical protein